MGASVSLRASTSKGSEGRSLPRWPFKRRRVWVWRVMPAHRVRMERVRAGGARTEQALCLGQGETAVQHELTSMGSPLGLLSDASRFRPAGWDPMDREGGHAMPDCVTLAEPDPEPA